MLIGGIQKTTLVDYPGKVAATIFTIGCNFRCPFCHNPGIVKGIVRVICAKEILDFLKKRKKILDGVCLSGGEPTLQSDLVPFIQKIKKMGYAVKLDTNGSRPAILNKLLKLRLVDYVALDIKAPWRKYPTIVNRALEVNQVKKSLSLLLAGSVPYELRSTILPALHSLQDIKMMAKQIKGAPNYYLQLFRTAPKLVDDRLRTAPSYTLKQLKDLLAEIKGGFQQCQVR